MPFTFAHAAAAIPISAKWKDKFCTTGLVLGTMAPDFEYFVHLSPYATYGHQLLGFFLINLPLCYVLAFLYHYALKVPLLQHLPKPINQWMSPFAQATWKMRSLREMVLFAGSALLGMITHVAWDSFTHSHGLMVSLLPFLSHKLTAFGFTFYLYSLLQHGSSLIGLLAILHFLYQKGNAQKKTTIWVPARHKLLYHILAVIISLSVTLGIMLIGSGSVDFRSPGSLVVTTIDGVFLGLLLTSFISRTWRDTR